MFRLINRSLFAGILAAITLFTYGSPDGRSKLKFAWSENGSEWHSVGQGYEFLSCDFGPWGSSKRIFEPQLGFSKSENTWYCSWKAMQDGSVIAIAKSSDLSTWKPQEYFRPEEDGKHMPADLVAAKPTTATVDGEKRVGVAIEADRALVNALEAYAKDKQEKAARNAESARDDAQRFADITEVNGVLRPYLDYGKTISHELMGIFFEDINYAADGGIYAELVQNRDFEYSADEQRTWGPMSAWSVSSGDCTVSTTSPLHANNPHHIVVNGPAKLSNSGWDGIAVKAGNSYDFNIFACGKGTITAKLVSSDGKTLAAASVKTNGKAWQKYSAEMTADSSCSDATLEISFPKGEFRADMISLFPRDTFHGRKNGLRADLAQTLADMKPKFVRFPGGCVAHGNGLDNMYDWKGSVGPLEARKPLRNIWNYHQTRGLGYFEYFQFCEDIGAEPLPVLAAGVPCQNSGRESHYTHDNLSLFGQQEGIPMEEMGAYIQDILDLIEWANGPADSKWGRIRAEAGHPQPFKLKYLGIGNEDLISPVFEERFKMIYDAVRKAHPEITVVGTVGPFYEGSDYDEGWKLAKELNIPIVDEHYYVSPGWMVNNQDYYDNYDRKGTKVYLGEYAAHTAGRDSNLESALAEALYLTSVERNADVVQMCSYAPLLAKKGHHQWTPDLIWFDNEKVYPTVNYQVQKLFGNNSGNQYIPCEVALADASEDISKRIGVSIVGNGYEYIIKVVNYLPVPFKAGVDVGMDISGFGLRFSRTTLTGALDSKDAVPTQDSISLDGRPIVFPAYSLTVLRISL